MGGGNEKAMYKKIGGEKKKISSPPYFQFFFSCYFLQTLYPKIKENTPPMKI